MCHAARHATGRGTSKREGKGKYRQISYLPGSQGFKGCCLGGTCRLIQLPIRWKAAHASSLYPDDAIAIGSGSLNHHREPKLLTSSSFGLRGLHLLALNVITSVSRPITAHGLRPLFSIGDGL